MKKAFLIAALASMAATLPAHAVDDIAPQVTIESKFLETTRRGPEFGIDIFNQNTRAALPSTGSSIQAIDGSVLGVQLTYLYYLSSLFILAQGGYGFGNQTQKLGPPQFGPPINPKEEIALKMLLLSGGMGYFAPITSRIGLRTTVQLMYEQSIATRKFAGNEDDGPTYNSLGLAVALGTTYEIMKRWQFRAELYNLYSYGWISEDEAELLEWVKFSCYRLGVSRSF